MRITLNGRSTEVPGAEQVTLAALFDRALLEDAGHRTDGLAAAVNGEVVPRAEHGRTTLRPGDVVDVVRAVQGG